MVFVALLAAGTFIPRPFFDRAAASLSDDNRRNVKLLVLSNPIHTDIALPLDAQVLASFGFLADHGVPITHPDARWLVIGWGGRSFYLETPRWSELKFGPVFKALTVDRSVLHVEPVGAIDEGASGVTVFERTPSEVLDLQHFVLQSFSRNEGNVMPVDGPGYGANDRFFEAEGLFNALIGCNTWSARALRVAGLRTGLWNPLPQSLTLSLRLFN